MSMIAKDYHRVIVRKSINEFPYYRVENPVIANNGVFKSIHKFWIQGILWIAVSPIIMLNPVESVVSDEHDII